MERRFCPKGTGNGVHNGTASPGSAALLGQCDRGSSRSYPCGQAAAGRPVRCYRLWTPGQGGRHCPLRRPRAGRLLSRRPTRVPRSVLRGWGRSRGSLDLPGRGRVRDAGPAVAAGPQGRDQGTKRTQRLGAAARRVRTAVKWEAVTTTRSASYVVCNADETSRAPSRTGADGSRIRTPDSRAPRSWATLRWTSRARSHPGEYQAAEALAAARRRQAASAAFGGNVMGAGSASTSRCGGEPGAYMPAGKPRDQPLEGEEGLCPRKTSRRSRPSSGLVRPATSDRTSGNAAVVAGSCGRAVAAFARGKENSTGTGVLPVGCVEQPGCTVEFAVTLSR